MRVQRSGPRHATRAVVLGLLRWSGLTVIARWTLQRDRATILLYHNPSPEILDRHLSVLRRRYSIVPLRDVVAAVEKKSMCSLPRWPLAITLDDGYAENAHLRPVLEKHRVPVTIFICSGLVGCKAEFLDLADPPLLLSEADVRDFSSLVDFQPHTVTHARLHHCDDAAALAEVAGAKNHLENDFGLDVYAIAFPNGDYTSRDCRLAADSGYRAALTVDGGFNDDCTDVYRLRRIAIDDRDGITALLVKAAGVWPFLKCLVLGKQHGHHREPARFSSVESS